MTYNHYDASYNFFLQVRGRKRFTLRPPGSPLYPYPCLHPHYGHSQIDHHRLNPEQLKQLFPAFDANMSTGVGAVVALMSSHVLYIAVIHTTAAKILYI